MGKKHFFAAAVGRQIGIYDNWDACKEQVNRFPNANFKGFSMLDEAKEWYQEQTGQPITEEILYFITDKVQVQPVKSATAEMNHHVEEDHETGTEVVSTEEPAGIIAQQKTQTEDLMDKLQRRVIESRKHPELVPVSVEAYCKKYKDKDASIANFSDDQKRAVGTILGHALLFAVPGSGKTAVIVARTGYLLHGEHGKSIFPDSVMTLTFGKKAAEEMGDRYRAVFPEDPENKEKPGPYFKTIHSFCLTEVISRLDKKGYRHPNYLLGTPYKINNKDGKEVTEMLQVGTVVSEALKKVEKFTDSLQEEDYKVLTIAVTAIKNRMLQPDEYRDKIILVNNTPINVEEFFNAYQEILHNKYNSYDFDDMLYYAWDGLQKFPEVLQNLQNRYRYWSIDEAQDNSKLQNEVLKLLLGEKGVLFMVGDDDQSIYGFRGAEPQLLLKYGTADKTKNLVMGTNYRSDSYIVNTARSFIEENTIRADKEMRVSNGRAQGEIQFYTCLQTAREQYEHIVKQALKAQTTFLQRTAGNKKEKADPVMAVIYRLNSSAVPVAFWLKKAGIPFNISKGFGKIMGEKIFSQAVACLYFLEYPASLNTFKHIYMVLKMRHINKKLKDLQILAKNHPRRSIMQLIPLLNFGASANAASDEYKNAEKWLKKLQPLSTYETLRFLFQENILSVDVKKPGDRLCAYGLLSAAEAWPERKGFLQALEDIKRETKDTSEETNEKKEDLSKDNHAPLQGELLEAEAASMIPAEEIMPPVVQLMTMHASKGLQFEAVLIIDSWEPALVGAQNSDTLTFDDPEEERRLFYVAMTRAKNHLEFLTVQRYHGNVEMPLHYLQEIAAFYEDEANNIIVQKPENAFDSPGESVLECLLKPAKYYAVRIGKKPGIYQSWNECRQYVDRYPDAKYKHFSTLREAELYLDLDEGNRQKPAVSCQFLQDIFLQAEAITFNRPCDLPTMVNRAITDWFRVSSIEDLASAEMSRLHNRQIHFDYKSATNYHDFTDSYLLSYLPVHFYKSWLPLNICLCQNLLPDEVSILELGSGPGTTTMAMFTFYQKVASENPDRQFCLHYQAVERDAEFIGIFESLVGKVRQEVMAVAPNLNIQMDIKKGDILDNMPKLTTGGYDLLIESNVFNSNEGMDRERCASFTSETVRCLKPKGLAIIVEPDCRKMPVWNSLEQQRTLHVLAGPRRSSVDISRVGLMQTALQLGLRHKDIPSHRFTYAVYEKV